MIHRLLTIPWIFVLALSGLMTPDGLGGRSFSATPQPGLSISLRRDFGYASGTGKIQGVFSIRASGPPDLIRIVYYLDDQPMGEVAQAPFSLKFSTDSYPLGLHTLRAVGYTADGREISSNEIRVQFVSAEEGWQAGMRIAGPILLIVAVVMVLSFAATFFSARKLKDLPPGTPRSYGPAGGAICSRCRRPFARHVLSLNMLVGKLERCPFCGKWSILAAAPPAMLRAAEQAELENVRAASAPGLDADEKLRKELEESRYRDL